MQTPIHLMALSTLLSSLGGWTDVFSENLKAYSQPEILWSDDALITSDVFCNAKLNFNFFQQLQLLLMALREQYKYSLSLSL